MKIERHVRYNLVKLSVNETIIHVNKTIINANEAIKYEELESNNKTTTCADKDKQTSIVYGIKGEEKTSSTSENKEKERDGYVCIYE